MINFSFIVWSVRWVEWWAGGDEVMKFVYSGNRLSPTALYLKYIMLCKILYFATQTKVNFLVRILIPKYAKKNVNVCFIALVLVVMIPADVMKTIAIIIKPFLEEDEVLVE